MAYEKQNWDCGEVITADKLNHIEDGIANASEGGSCDCGFSCTETYASLFSGSVTTTGKDEYNPSATSVLARAFTDFPLSLKVIFNGTEYICPAYEYSQVSDARLYGANVEWDEQEQTETFDWSEYPFTITIYLDSPYLSIQAENDGTYQMQIQYLTTEVETSECFDKAVNSIVTQPLMLGEYSYYDEATDTGGTRLEDSHTHAAITAQELADAIERGCTVWVKASNFVAPLRGFFSPSSCGSTQYKAWIVTYDGSTLADKVFEANQNTNFEFINIE